MGAAIRRSGHRLGRDFTTRFIDFQVSARCHTTCDIDFALWHRECPL